MIDSLGNDKSDLIGQTEVDPRSFSNEIAADGHEGDLTKVTKNQFSTNLQTASSKSESWAKCSSPKKLLHSSNLRTVKSELRIASLTTTACSSGKEYENFVLFAWSEHKNLVNKNVIHIKHIQEHERHKMYVSHYYASDLQTLGNFPGVA